MKKRTLSLDADHLPGDPPGVREDSRRVLGRGRHHRARRAVSLGRADAGAAAARDEHQRLHEGAEGQARAAGPVPGARRPGEGSEVARRRHGSTRRSSRSMFERGVQHAHREGHEGSFDLFFEPGDVIGIKVNPVGPPLINTHVELTRAVVGVAHRQQGRPRSHRHLGPLRLHAQRRGLHPDASRRACGSKACRPWTRTGTRGRTRTATTSASTTSTRTSSTSPRASSARA